MVNWKKWFLEENEDEVFEETKKKRSEKTKEDEDEFDIEFSSDDNKTKYDYEDDAEEINLEDYEYDEIAEDEEEYEELNSEPKKSTKKVRAEGGIFSRVKNLFQTNDKPVFEDEDDFSDEEEAEDYKTYLERQKRRNNPEESEEKNYKEGFFSRLKEKFFNVEEEEDKDLDALFDDMYEEDQLEEKKEKNALKEKKEENFVDDVIEEDFEQREDEIDFVELRRKNRQKVEEKVVEENYSRENYEEDFDEDFSEKEGVSFDEIDLAEFEEKEEKPTEKTTNLSETLKKLGVQNAEIRDVDIFGDKSERRTHPTLAAVRTKRLKQDHKIENLANEVVLGRDNKDLKEEVAKAYKKEEIVEKQEEKTTKEREKIAEDFNKRTRREDKIEKGNVLYAKKDEKFEAALDEIEEKGTKKYEKEVPELEVKELEAEGERRDKLKYTSVDDVLRGADDLFEDDIDRVSKKLVGDRFDKEKATEEVEEFRKDLYEDKKKETSSEKTVLDELIEKEEIDINKKEETLPEIEELNSNLKELQKDKFPKTHEEEHEEVVKKVDRLAGYSDYHLDEEEIEELEEINYIEENADNMNIDNLIREVSPNNKVLKRSNDIDKFVDEKIVPKEISEKRIATQAEKNQEQYDDHEEDYYEDYDDYEDERGIKYTEKLYTNDVSEYFDNGEGKKLGEYKIVDHGYRPVSKEKIENNQRILDEIFAKYSGNTVSAPKKSVTSTMMETNTITPKKRNVGKFKPSPVYSSIYGSGPRKAPAANTSSVTTPPVQPEEKRLGISQVGLSINEPEKKQEPVKKETIAPKKVEEPASIYKEIAAQEDTVWNIGTAKRVPKNKGKKANKKK